MPVVFIVDDDRDVRQALAFLLGTAHYETRLYASAAEFLAVNDWDIHGCVLMDLVMPGMNGLQAQAQLAALGSRLPVVFLTGYGSVPDSVAAMRAGAISFLTKPVDQHSLFCAIDEALSVDATRRSSHHFCALVEKRLATLTPREREVLAHVVAGRMNKQIAADLGTVVKTIKVHRARVMRKTKVRSLAQLIRIIVESGVPIGLRSSASHDDDRNDVPSAFGGCSSIFDASIRTIARR